jgi:hypothetical protein
MSSTTARKLRRALTRAIVVLTERRFLTTEAAERDEIDIEIQKLEQKRERIHQLIIADSLATLNPPTDLQMRQIAKAARDLDDIAAANTTASAVLALVRAASEVITT